MIMIKLLNTCLVNSLYSQRINGSLNAQNNNEPASVKQFGTSAAVSFGGVTKQMKKRIYIDGQKDIQSEVVDKHKGKSLMVGQLPPFMINKLPKENRKECIKEIYDAFDKITEELRNFDETQVTTIEEIRKRRKNSTKELFENVMRKYGFVNKWDDVDIQYLGKGGKGAGYKLVGLRDPFNEDEYVIKVYHQITGKNWHYFKSHGAYAEINSAAYWMENAGYETQRGKFFFGNLDTGYMFLKYVDEDVRLPKKNLNPYHYGLKCTDENIYHKHNVCKGYSFDWGGVRVINRTKNGSKTSRYVGYLIKDASEKDREILWEKIYADKKMDKSQKNAGLAISIKHLPNKEQYIDRMIALHDPLVDRGLAYVLKYLKYSVAIKYFEKLVQTDDVITQVILFNEIPLLAMKHRDLEAKDDLQTMRSEILTPRVKAYYDISEKYALPESIEHLASFVHLLPREDFKEYYKKLADTDNEALLERLIYKFPFLPAKEYNYCVFEVAKNVKDEELKENILNSFSTTDAKKRKELEEILGMKFEDVQK